MYVFAALLRLVNPAAALEPQDRLDLWYLRDTMRGAEAVPWTLQQMQLHPEDPRAVLDWIDAVSQDFGRNSALVVRQVDAWAAGQPDGAEQRAARVAARVLASNDDRTVSSALRPGEPGPWCDEALALLDPLPADDPDRLYTAIWWRNTIASTCGRDGQADRDRLKQLALDGSVRVPRQVRWRLQDGVESDEIALITATADAEPWRLPELCFLFGDEASGAALEDARAALREIAARLAASARPAELTIAAELLEADHQDGSARAVRERLASLDPENNDNNDALQPDDGPDDETDPMTVVDPALRLEALGERPPRSLADWRLAQWWRVRYETLLALGREDEAFEALSKLWKVEGGTAVNLEFARAAIARGERLREAKRAIRVAVEDRWEPGPPTVGADAARQHVEWAQGLADALSVRASLQERRGDRDDAIDDLELSIALDGGDATRLARLGLLYASDGIVGDAARVRDLLGAALAMGGLDEGTRAKVETTLISALTATHTWIPDGVDGYLALVAASLAPVDVAPAPETPPRLPDVPYELNGQPARLGELRGPVVLDLWATWCGPCKMALPHLDQMARQYAGRVQFIALSVDDTRELPVAYLAKQGSFAFTTAWIDPEAKKPLGIEGIPSFYILDADGRVVHHSTGYGLGGDELEVALDGLLRSP